MTMIGGGFMAAKDQADGPKRMKRKAYEKALVDLQVELCHLQEWVKQAGLRIVVVFEGRDAAGKGGVIRRITERVSPRIFRTVALPKPDERERSQLYVQRYVQHMPAAGEVVLFDRSWYNRAGVEPVMGFCTAEETARFLEVTPVFEQYLVDDGIILIKYFLDVSRDVQLSRFRARAEDPRKHWKLSPMDIESLGRWWDYSAAYARMIEATDRQAAPWIRVPADDKRAARLNCIADLLSRLDYRPHDFVPPALEHADRRPPETSDALPFRHEVAARY